MCSEANIIYSKVNNFCEQLLFMSKHEIKFQRRTFHISHKKEMVFNQKRTGYL